MNSIATYVRCCTLWFLIGRIKEDARPLADRELEGLIGWNLQRG